MWWWWWWLFFVFIFSEPIFATHFYGGTIRWAPVNNNISTSPVEITITQTYTYTLSSVTCSVGSLIGSTTYGFNFSLWCTLNCGATSAGYVAPPVLGYCTGSSPGKNIAFAQRTDIVNLTANDYFSISHSIPNTATQGYYRSLSLTSGGTDTTAQWNITTSIDIRPRADNGLINTPPIASIMSPYGIPYNIPTQIVIPTMDVDGDDVRCRWGNSSLECGDVCFPRTIPASTTLSSDCILTITGTSTTGWYCASLQVEDFLNTSTSLQPMSSVPVQFLIYVYTPKNCSVPTLTSPFACVGVQVGISYTVTLTAINSCGSSSNISDIAIQAFSGITKGSLVLVTPNKTVYTMNITYTPLASQVGLQILCAIAFDNTYIPSDQYCVTFIVGSTVAPTCPGITSTTFQTSTSKELTTNAETTGTTSKSVIVTSQKNLQTSDTTHIEATSQLEITPSDTTLLIYSSSTSTATTNSVSSSSNTTNSVSSSSNTITSVSSSSNTTNSVSSSSNTITSVSSSSNTTNSVSSSSNTTTSVSSSSNTTPFTFASLTTSAPKSNSINWLLIGSLIGLMSLLTLLGSFCCCYYYFWSASARRRRRRQQTDKNTLRYKPVSERMSDSSKIAHPPKPYQIFNMEADKAKPSAICKNYLRTKRSSSTITNIIQPKIKVQSITSATSISHNEQPEVTNNNIPLRPLPKENNDDTIENIIEVEQNNNSIKNNSSTKDNTKQNRVKSAISITRVQNTKRRKSMPNERKRRSSNTKIFVTRVKRNVP